MLSLINGTIGRILIFVLIFGAASAIVSAATFTVNRADDAGDGICDATCTLRDAVIETNANQGADDDIINFAPFLSAITLNNEIAVDQSAGKLVLNGPGADRVTIDGGAGTNRIFYTFLSNSVGSEFQIEDVTLTGGNGGGFCINTSFATLSFVTVTDNTAFRGGIAQLSAAGTLNFGNSIIAGNKIQPGGGNPEIYRSNSLMAFVSEGFNLIGDDAGDATDTGVSITYQGSDILDTPPLPGALNMNGGTTPTLALLAGSPAIDSGDNALAALDDAPLVTDQRGFLRTVGLAPPIVDIGAFEFGAAANWSAPTATGANVNISHGPVTINFSGVTQTGNTFVNPINPASAGSLPTGFSPGAGLPAFEISTTAVFTPPITVCIQVPFVTNPTDFAVLTLFHGENGRLVDRTISRNFVAKTVCALVTSLSPFVVAVNLAPTAANVSVSDRVLSADGTAISKASVSITDPNGATRTTVSNSFGFYRFSEIQSGATYVISVAYERYRFSSQILNVNEKATEFDLIAAPEDVLK